MTAEIIHQPREQHRCGPNRYGFWLVNTFDPPGTMRQCGMCGKTWVAYRDELDLGYVGVKWRREGRLARWWRERREARS